MVEIGREYARHIDWSKQNILPWQTKGGQRDPKELENPKIDWSTTPFAPKKPSGRN
jgi:hypothetical protein